MKFCYLDESGTGNEPFAVMVGIVVDAQRMHLTKKHWNNLLRNLSNMVGKPVKEIHTRDLYAGNGPWRGLAGPKRSKIIDTIFDWIVERKHHFVYSAVDRAKFAANFNNETYAPDIKTLWRFMGLHTTLAIQKNYQKEEKTKGHTVLIFDNEDTEAKKFSDLIKNPPSWSDTYYSKKKKQEQLSHIIDVPYFGDSTEVALVQVADFVAYFFRRYLEIEENVIGPKYAGEKQKVTKWCDYLFSRSIKKPMMYPKTKRCECSDLFYRYAPESITS